MTTSSNENENENDENNENNENTTDRPFYVYLLESSISKTTYVGATVNLERRLRQHNKELVGGAHATGSKVAKGESWSLVCYITGFPNWVSALQFEWRFKQLSRKLPRNMPPVERRQIALKQLLELDRATSKAIPYSEWKTPPQIIGGPFPLQQKRGQGGPLPLS